MKYLFPFILAALFMGLSVLIKAPSQPRQDAKAAWGVIDQVSRGDGGNVNYYVNLTIDGQTVRAKSVTYSSSTAPLHKGEQVQVQYYFTKAGNARVVIQDERIISCEQAAPGGFNLFKILSILLIAFGVFQLIGLFV